MSTSPNRPPIDYASPEVRRPPQPGNPLKLTLYLCLGNLWLLVALALYVGRTYERSAPSMYSAWGVGRWFYPGEYTALVLVPAALGITFCCLAARHARRLPPER